MGDLHGRAAGERLAVEGEQPVLAVACEDLVENRRLDLEPPKLAPAHAAARVLCLGVDRHEAQEDLPRGLPRRRIESLVELLGATAERADDAARRAVALVRQEVARPAREQLRERVLEERQRPRLVVHVGHDLRDEAGLEANTHLRGGALDRERQVVLRGR